MNLYRFSSAALILLLLVPATLAAQYTGGNFDGYASSRSDDILYEGIDPVVTGDELPDIVHNLTIDNTGGVTLSKDITVIGKLTVLSGFFDLNGFLITLGPNAVVSEQPGATIRGGAGVVTVTKDPGDLTGGQNISGLGLDIITPAAIGRTSISRGHAQQNLTPLQPGIQRFFDVEPSKNNDLDATVDFTYDETELAGLAEDQLAMFISHDAPAAGPVTPLSVPSIGAAAANTGNTPTWQILGGSVDASKNRVCKGDINDFSRLTLGRSYVFFAGTHLRIHDPVDGRGDVHANQSVHIGKGRGTLVGNISTAGIVAIGAKNRIEGDIVAGRELRISPDAEVTGNAFVESFLAIDLPEPEFTAGDRDICVEHGETVHLPPGRYGEIEVRGWGRLVFVKGTYHIRELELKEKARMLVDVTDGPVEVNVVDCLEIGTKAKIRVGPGRSMSSTALTITTLQHDRLEVGKRALVMGNLIAPAAPVIFAEDGFVIGSVIAKAIRVGEDVRFFGHGTLASNVLHKEIAAHEAQELTAFTPATLPSAFELEQNHPNPFNPSTFISFSLPEALEVGLQVFDVNGRLVRTLLDGAREAGRHSVLWDGTNDAGARVASGLYVYRIQAGSYRAQRKLTLLK